MIFFYFSALKKTTDMLRILITALLVCPFISFGQSEDVTPNNNVLIGLENLGKNRASFGFPSFIKKTNK